MQVNKIGTITPNFSSKNITREFGVDDTISQERRIYIREHYQNQQIPYYDILSGSKRLEEYELNKLLVTLCGKNFKLDSFKNITKKNEISTKTIDIITRPNNLNHELINSLPLMNLNLVSKKLGVYRGQTLQGNLYALETLKKAGITQIVDLAGYENLEDSCKKLGLDYFDYHIDPITLTKSPIFETKEDIIHKATTHSRLFGYNELESKIYKDRMLKHWEKDKENKINYFIKFIQIMNKGNLYIGCEYGTHSTNNALMLNAFFNPLYARTPKYVDYTNRNFTKSFIKLYQNLNSEHKKLMGWTKDFDKRLAKTLIELAR